VTTGAPTIKLLKLQKNTLVVNFLKKLFSGL